MLTVPGDMGGRELPSSATVPTFVDAQPPTMPPPDRLAEVAGILNDADRVTMLVGQGAREARDEVLRTADALAAPMVLTLKAKEGLEHANDFEVGQSGLIGNPAAQTAFEDCDVLLMVGTDFPYRDWYPSGKTVVQLDIRAQHIGRRTHVMHALVGHALPTLRVSSPC